MYYKQSKTSCTHGSKSVFLTDLQLEDESPIPSKRVLSQNRPSWQPLSYTALSEHKGTAELPACSGVGHLSHGRSKMCKQYAASRLRNTFLSLVPRLLSLFILQVIKAWERGYEQMTFHSLSLTFVEVLFSSQRGSQSLFSLTFVEVLFSSQRGSQSLFTSTERLSALVRGHAHAT